VQHNRPEWARECRDCVKWEYGKDGPILLNDRPIPRQGKPPCWNCAKHGRSDLPFDQRLPLPEGWDFGPWYYSLVEWYHAGQACGFGDVTPLMRQAGGIIHQAEQRRRERLEAQRMDSMTQLITLALKRR
jgi:hypothetical protein